MIEQLKRDYADLQIEYRNLYKNVQEGQATLTEMAGVLKYLKARIEATGSPQDAQEGAGEEIAAE